MDEETKAEWDKRDFEWVVLDGSSYYPSFDFFGDEATAREGYEREASTIENTCLVNIREGNG